jgi:dihydropteroate synthase
MVPRQAHRERDRTPGDPVAPMNLPAAGRPASSGTPAPIAAGTLRLGRHRYPPAALLVMAIVNRTPDSFYDKGATYGEAAALDAVAAAVACGADIIDIGGVKAAPGDEVDVAEELRRTVTFVGRVRERWPQVAISVDTWRSEVGDAVCAAGADLLNDAWGGADPRLAEVAAAHDVALVCTHVGRQAPRTVPHRVAYPDVVADVIERTGALAARAQALGVAPESILVDPAHDFGKNTWHSLEVTRRLPELVATGRPVLVSLSRKDFVGETLNLPTAQRLNGTLAATAVCAWLGARVFRAHDVAATRQVLDMTASMLGTRPPAAATRALA